jgi:hypothetical protein
MQEGRLFAGFLLAETALLLPIAAIIAGFC